MTVRHVILDRDGVLNVEAPSGWVVDVGGWQWEAGVLDALRVLTERSIAISVATNQSCVGRGFAEREEVDRLHAWLAHEVAHAGGRIDRVLTCAHAPSDGCTCRKPRPGLLLRAIDESGVSPRETVMVGDDLSDVAAARAAGIGALLVRTGKGTVAERRLEGNARAFDTLCDVVHWLARST